MARTRTPARFIVLVLIAAAAWLTAAGRSMADKLYLKDGRVLEGAVEREGDGFLYFKVKIGGLENVQFFTSDQYTKLVKDASAPATNAAAKPADEKGKTSANADRGKATRVAILDFGPPGYWNGEVGDMVGVQISAQAWRDAIPMLEADHVDVVVVRVNSGGGYGLEVDKFFDVFQNEYKPRFRTVAWVESAISAAAMSPWCIEEFYMMPQGNIGACTGWYGNLVAVKGVGLEEALFKMEKISRAAGRDPRIMRSMQIMEPLSCDIDPETGEIKWYQNLDGQNIVNPEGRILAFNATDAVKYKFAKGIAATKEELAQVMGLTEVEWAGQKATDYIDNNIRDGDKTEKRINEVYTKYANAVAAATATNDPKVRGGFIAKARRFLHEMKRMIDVNPNFEWVIGINDEWFEQQEELLRRLVK